MLKKVYSWASSWSPSNTKESRRKAIVLPRENGRVLVDVLRGTGVILPYICMLDGTLVSITYDECKGCCCFSYSHLL
jgi:hypothetical protein